MKTELPRKIFHIIFGVIFLLLISFAGTETSLYIITLLFIGGFIMALAIKRGHKFWFIEKIISRVEREHEKHFPGKGALYFFIAAVILLYFFRGEPLIVLAALSVEIFGDSAAALVGKGIGKIKIGVGSTLEGTLACLIVSIIVLGFYFPISTFPIAFVIIPAILATIVEYLPMNDNVSMPLITAISLYVLQLVL